MKALTAQTTHFLRKESTRKNLKTLVRLLLVLAVIVLIYSVIFHVLMMREGREYSWFTGVYWTLTVMSTLGFGDITFESDLGRVGSAAGRALSERGLRYRIVEQNPELVREPEEYVLGNAAELNVLKQAGIDEAPAVIITTHDDDMNVYLTIYCRRLRPDIQIITRVALERNISSLHRAGADFVMSYASMGANSIFNLLERSGSLMVAEGLELFRVKMPASLAGKTIAESGIRRTTGCTVIALDSDGTTQINPDPTRPMSAGAEMILIGSAEDESRFLEEFVKR